MYFWTLGRKFDTKELHFNNTFDKPHSDQNCEINLIHVKKTIKKSFGFLKGVTSLTHALTPPPSSIWELSLSLICTHNFSFSSDENKLHITDWNWISKIKTKPNNKVCINKPHSQNPTFPLTITHKTSTPSFFPPLLISLLFLCHGRWWRMQHRAMSRVGNGRLHAKKGEPESEQGREVHVFGENPWETTTLPDKKHWFRSQHR